MSLFGSLMGDLDDDPIFGSHMHSIRHMNNMMNSLFNDPFGMMGQNALTDGSHRARMPQNDLQMTPFGFPPMPMFNMGRLFAGFDDMTSNGNCHSYTNRSVMTMVSGPDGRPQVYQETMSTTTVPGGVKETKKTVCDSRSGTKKMAIGHHIGDRAHIMEREQNLHSGEQEERQEFINLDEEEADSFNSEWQACTRRGVGALAGSSYGTHAGHSRSRPEYKQLALPDPSSACRHPSSSRWSPSTRRTLRLPPTSRIHSSTHVSSSAPSGNNKSASAKPKAGSSSSSSPSATVTGNRKREHTADTKVCKKRHAVSDSDV